MDLEHSNFDLRHFQTNHTKILGRNVGHFFLFHLAIQYYRRCKYYFLDAAQYEVQYFTQEMENRNIAPKSHEISRRILNQDEGQ